MSVKLIVEPAESTQSLKRVVTTDGLVLAHFLPGELDTHCLAEGRKMLDGRDYTGQKTITISLLVENAYESGATFTYTVRGQRIPAPPTLLETTEAYESWAYDHIFCEYTGLGITEGDSWYDVTVLESSEPALTGRTFAWGY